MPGGGGHDRGEAIVHAGADELEAATVGQPQAADHGSAVAAGKSVGVGHVLFGPVEDRTDIGSFQGRIHDVDVAG